MENNKKKKMLVVVPRAADTALLFSGTIAKYAKNGWKIVMVAATSENREIEKKELNATGQIINFSHAYFLRYKTGGLKQAGVDNPKEDILQIIEDEKPNVILSVARHGYSQNPDAVTTSLATVLAFEKFCKIHPPEIQSSPTETPSLEAIPTRFPIPALYFFCFPGQFLSFVESKGFLRKDAFGFNFEGAEDRKITHVIDVKNFVKQKIEALRNHKSAERETSRMIELLKTYKSSHMDYYMKYPFEETDKISGKF